MAHEISKSVNLPYSSIMITQLSAVSRWNFHLNWKWDRYFHPDFILIKHFSAWKQKSAPSPGAAAPAPATNNNGNGGDKDKEKNPNVDIDHSMAACRLTGPRKKGRAFCSHRSESELRTDRRNQQLYLGVVMCGNGNWDNNDLDNMVLAVKHSSSVRIFSFTREKNPEWRHTPEWMTSSDSFLTDWRPFIQIFIVRGELYREYKII